jgi:hypothetical protein
MGFRQNRRWHRKAIMDYPFKLGSGFRREPLLQLLGYSVIHILSIDQHPVVRISAGRLFDPDSNRPICSGMEADTEKTPAYIWARLLNRRSGNARPFGAWATAKAMRDF